MPASGPLPMGPAHRCQCWACLPLQARQTPRPAPPMLWAHALGLHEASRPKAPAEQALSVV
eukprot:CAMPEP_0180512536 /NCGR_PEP_ID=MMETSP1036_2-20121128/51650_1 /TAXON_ID=632150 /ORGANISM="Azadinium spinosum, Strain 3D9" /LENGTH=60 /DNA_ID=CAMNT_0022523701 /DNA_START=456 /DNA_END=638 /DNA_ORIENTATION=+